MADTTLVFTVPVELRDVVIDIVNRVVGIKNTIYSAAAATGDVNSNATSDAKEVEKEVIQEKEEEKFEPPTFETVRWYMRGRRSPVAPERFYNWMQRHNWHDGNGQPIIDWKKKVEDWEAREVVKKPYAKPQRAESKPAQDDSKRLERLLNINREANQNT